MTSQNSWGYVTDSDSSASDDDDDDSGLADPPRDGLLRLILFGVMASLAAFEYRDQAMSLHLSSGAFGQERRRHMHPLFRHDPHYYPDTTFSAPILCDAAGL